LPESIVEVTIVVGKHEVDSIPQVMGTQVAVHFAVRHKFKIDPVPMAINDIIVNENMVRFPNMDTVAGTGFRTRLTIDPVIPNRAV
jgi:hypothetical protein